MAAGERLTLVEAARSLGWEPDPATRAFLRALGAAIGRRRGPARVAVLTSGDDRLARVLIKAKHRARVTVVDGSATASEVHVAMSAGGRFDVVVDDAGCARDRVALFRGCFPHLRPHGSYLVSDVEPDGVLAHRLAELQAQDRRQPRGRNEQDDVDLARTIGEVTVEHHHVVVTSRGRAWAKVSEDEVDRVLALRGGSAGRVVTRRPPVVFRSRGTLRQSPRFRAGPPSRQQPFPETYDVPAVSLREYHDVVCLSGQVALLDNVVLPDSYRKNQRRRLRNHRIRDVGPRFGVPRGARGEVRDLEGPFFYLDSEYRGHFGHAMTEQLSRLWAWQEAKERHPGLRALMLGTAWSPRLKGFEKALYAAAGVAPDDLVLADGPVRVERLLAATPMFSQPFYVHPDLCELWDRVGRALA